MKIEPSFEADKDFMTQLIASETIFMIIKR
jgi:hypothetical protein